MHLFFLLKHSTCTIFFSQINSGHVAAVAAMSSGRRRPPVSLTATPWLRGLPCGVTYFKFLFTPTHRHSTTHRFMTDAPANDAARAPSGDDAPHRRPTTPRVHQAATTQHLRHRRALPWTAPPPTSRAVVSPQCPLANYNGAPPPARHPSNACWRTTARVTRAKSDNF